MTEKDAREAELHRAWEIMLMGPEVKVDGKVYVEKDFLITRIKARLAEVEDGDY